MPQDDNVQSAGIFPDEVLNFIASAIVAGDMLLPSSYPEPAELETWQVGFRSHGITGEGLVSTKSGAWQPGWYVVALNGFDDPFFIDIGETVAGFPVYYARHGAGRWDALAVAASLRDFGRILSCLRGMAGDDARMLRFLEAETDVTNALWCGVHEACRHRQAQEEQPAPPKQDYDPADFRSGTLFVTDIGPQKLKVIKILRQALGLSLQEVQALAGARDIVAGTGPLIRLRRLRDELTASGASVEFRPDAESSL
jgi:ribosomal protein L7/L12